MYKVKLIEVTEYTGVHLLVILLYIKEYKALATACLLELWVRIPPGAWMSVSYECCVLSGSGPCVGLINRLEASCRGRCV